MFVKDSKMHNNMIQLTEYRTTEPMYLDATTIVGIRPKTVEWDSVVAVGSEINVHHGRDTVQFSCIEMPSQVYALMEQELNRPGIRRVSRFELMEVEEEWKALL